MDLRTIQHEWWANQRTFTHPTWLPILIPTLYRQVAHPIGFNSIDDIQVSLAPTKIPRNLLPLPGIKVRVNHPSPAFSRRS